MPSVSRFEVPDLGIGVGFRVPHYRQVVDERPEMDWFEVISENFMVDGGRPLHWLDRLADAYPVVPHGVAMSVAGVEHPEHTARLRTLLDRLAPPWFSDHLCFTGTEALTTHDLLPVPYTDAVRDHIVDRIKRVQDVTGRLFAVENVSSYLTYKASTVPEWDFLADVLERADCAMLLDVNNIFVSAQNHGFDPAVFLDALPHDRVVQIHLAGHSIKDGYRLDTHDAPVCDEVWDLYAAAVRKVGSVSTLIEWDGHIPTFERLQQEARRAREVRDAALS
ncbi:MAG: DUF692 domain-containing protein [Myxococcales bacterium]|nr:DUF692 domain-containing protein [Myxococcales bacterium]